MSEKKHKFHNGTSGSAITVRVIPRSSRNEVAEILDDGTIKIRLTAPPVEGQANEALIHFLAHILDVPQSKVEIVAGQTGRDKLVTITDLDTVTAQARILQHLA